MKKTPKSILVINTALKLIDAITSKQHRELELFAENRLRRATLSGSRQRAQSLYCARSIVNSAFEKFAIGDAGLPGGRILKPHQRESVEVFLNAVRGAINSLISHALEKSEYQSDHIPIIISHGGDQYFEPLVPVNSAVDLELRDIEQSLFANVTRQLLGDMQLGIALESLRNDCITGHISGVCGDGVAVEAKRVVRNLARKELLKLLR